MQRKVLQICYKHRFNVKRHFFEMSIKINLLETAGHRVIDGVHNTITIGQSTKQIDRFSFSTAKIRDNFITRI